MRAQEEMRGDRTAPRPLLSTSINGDIYLGRPALTRKLEALVVTAGTANDDDTDADAWEAMLRDAGFDVHRLINPSSAQFAEGLDDFLGQRASEVTFQGQSNVVPSGAGAVSAVGPEANTLYFFVFVGQAAMLNGQTRLGFSDSTGAALEATTANLDTVASSFSARAAASVLIVDAAFTLDTGSATLSRKS
jgi:hypothetical protein